MSLIFFRFVSLWLFVNDATARSMHMPPWAPRRAELEIKDDVPDASADLLLFFLAAIFEGAGFGGGGFGVSVRHTPNS